MYQPHNIEAHNSMISTSEFAEYLSNYQVKYSNISRMYYFFTESYWLEQVGFRLSLKDILRSRPSKKSSTFRSADLRYFLTPNYKFYFTKLSQTRASTRDQI